MYIFDTGPVGVRDISRAMIELNEILTKKLRYESFDPNEKCLEATEMLLCALYTPKCEAGRALLPCREDCHGNTVVSFLLTAPESKSYSKLVHIKFASVAFHF